MPAARILLPLLIIMIVFGLISLAKSGPDMGQVAGIITTSAGRPLGNAKIMLAEIAATTFAEADGSFLIENVPSGTYTLQISARGFVQTNLIDLEVLPGRMAQISCSLTPASPNDKGRIESLFAADCLTQLSLGGTIKGKITDQANGNPLPGILVEGETGAISCWTDADGSYILTDLPAGKHRIKINAHGAIAAEKEIAVGRQETVEWNVALDAGKISPRLGRDLKDTHKNEVLYSMELSGVDALSMGQVYRNHKIQCAIVPPGQWLPHGGTTPPNGQPYSGTFFKHYGVNPFIDTEDDHLSTFAIDVDDASYAVMRNYIQAGHLPDAASVRTEEFINFFNYDYPAPHKERFDVYIEGAPSPFGKNCSLIRIGIKGQEIESDHRKPAVLTFVIDVSGSMAIDTRLGLVKKALRILVDNLREDDLVGIAVYADRGMKILDHTSIKEKDKILHAIEMLTPSGSTFAEEGLKIGYKMASENFREGAINRIILCSDGVANVGRTGHEQILKEIQEYVKQGITLTTVGFGMDNYNDILMEQLGNKGNGHFSYVDNLEQAKRIFLQNLTGTLQVIAKDVKIQVDFNPDMVRSYRLLGYENRDVEDTLFRDDTKDGGEIGSGHDVTALYEVKLRENASGKIATVYIRYKDPDLRDEVNERSFAITTGEIRSEFAQTSASFRLAACAAEFAEILRESYWAKEGNLAEVLQLVQEISYEMKGNDDVLELAAIVSRAKKLWEEKALSSSGN